MKLDEQEYLGDSVYAEFDGYYLVLTTNNGNGATNTIFLEPSVQVRLVEFIEQIVEAV